MAGSGGSDAGTVDCTHDPRVDTYTANLKHDGSQGVLTFTLVESTPHLPSVAPTFSSSK